MQITETRTEGLLHDFRIVVAAETLRTEVDGKLTEYARTTRLPGFRPGKVPLRVLRQRFGRAAVQEVVERTVSDGVRQAMDEHGLKPAATPELSIVSGVSGGELEGTDLEYTVSVEAMPRIEVMDLRALELERLAAEPTEADIDRRVALLAVMTAGTEKLEEDRGAQADDFLLVDFEGRADGEALEGQSATDYRFRLGAGTVPPEFDEGLIGARAGEERRVAVRFPEDHPTESLAGREVEFSISVKELQVGKAPTADDEWARALGFSDLADLRTETARNIRSECGEAARRLLKTKLFDLLDQGHDFPLPPGLVGTEFDDIWRQVREGLEGPESESVRDGKSDEELEADYRGIAERRVRLGLLITEIGQANGIEVNEEDIRQAIIAQAARLSDEGRRQLIDRYANVPEASMRLRTGILEEKVTDYVLELATVSTRDVGVAELLAGEAAPDAAAGEGEA